MANNRPIRSPRVPRWRRGRFTPRKVNRRWIDANSNIINDSCGCETSSLTCEPNLPRELLVGDLDIDWSDKSEVTIQRVLGSILLSGYTERTVADSLPAYSPIVRMGILVTEDTDRLYQVIDMGDPESLEEYEWMWLYNTLVPKESSQFFAGGVERSSVALTIPVDIRSKRKLGKKDSLVLYSQVALHVNAPTAFGFSMQMSEQLRTVLT